MKGCWTFWQSEETFCWELIWLISYFPFSIFLPLLFSLLGQFAWQWDLSCLRDHLLLLLISYLKLLSSVCDILIISTTINCDVTNGGLWLWVGSEIEKLKEFEEQKRLFFLKNEKGDRMTLVKWRQFSITFLLQVVEQLFFLSCCIGDPAVLRYVKWEKG